MLCGSRGLQLNSKMYFSSALHISVQRTGNHVLALYWSLLNLCCIHIIFNKRWRYRGIIFIKCPLHRRFQPEKNYQVRSGPFLPVLSIYAHYFPFTAFACIHSTGMYCTRFGSCPKYKMPYSK